MYYLLEFVLEDSNKDKRFVMVRMEEDDLINFTQEYITEKELIMASRDNTTIKNFSINRGYLNWSGRTLASPNFDTFVTDKKTYCNRIPGLFELLDYIVQNDGLFVPKKEDLSVVAESSNLRVSNSNMSIYVPYLGGVHQDFLNIVSTSNRGLEYHQFYFLMVDKLTDEVDSLATYKGLVNIDGCEMHLYQSIEDLVIYPLIEPKMYISAAVINYRAYMADMYRVASNSLNILLTRLIESSDDYDLPSMPRMNKFERTTVVLKNEHPFPSNKDLFEMIKRINDLLPEMSKDGGYEASLRKTLMNEFPGPFFEHAISVVIWNLFGGDYSREDRLDLMEKRRLMFHKRKIKNELCLFMYRALLCVSDREFMFGLSNQGVFRYDACAPVATTLVKTSVARR